MTFMSIKNVAFVTDLNNTDTPHLGDGGVGKSCLMNRFVSNRYDENNFHTIGVEFMNKDVNVDGEKYTLQCYLIQPELPCVNMTQDLKIWDTAGQERFRALRTPFYRGSDVCLLCYAIDDHDSFRGLKQWREEFLHYADVNVKSERFPFIVVGNKNDLASQCRQISSDEVKQWCEKFHIVSYIETSSKAATNISEAFTLAIRQWKHMERIAEVELKSQDIIDLTKSIRLAQNRFLLYRHE
uniref:Uncharacterized protein n=1 Tax=Glossina morsitans morsitans TaxID=37546 RepID=A0A1B0G782_GLOMM